MTTAWLPPSQYVQTIERATMYGCFFVTDTRGRPVQLLSVHGKQGWQFPGGNTDLDETPWQTAVREYHEETGLTFRGKQRLLLSHFLPRGESWPLAKVGFVFDGGILTDEQLESIRLDASEHRELRVASMAEWRRVMLPRGFERLEAVHAAREAGSAAFLSQ
ncbi:MULTISPECIES: NUDIX hydrolase [unclassified Streptomyces]|uniref:NUDIX hydrolase n=1 Tax=unclassified Streptomyces TaxID=2593676 RepID=UPI0032449F92